MTSPLELSSASAVGTVEFVSPVEIRVVLNLDAPQSTALNTGVPTAFPRLNGYVAIPAGAGIVVGLITWVGIERSDFPKRTGFKDFGLIDLPFPLRKLSIAPVGTLRQVIESANGQMLYEMERGVSTFPSVGDAVHIPTQEQLLAIVESHGENARVQIGVSPTAGNARVSVDPDRMFGRHLAVLGNTGSGKSCTVAGLIRWSLSAAAEARHSAGRASQPNARFIVLDPNGEYADAFADHPAGARVFQVPPGIGEASKEFHLPAWMWNSQEWTAFAEAAPRMQRPLLLQALRELRGDSEPPAQSDAARALRTVRQWLTTEQSSGKYTEYAPFKGIHTQLVAWSAVFERHGEQLQGGQKEAVENVAAEMTRIRGLRTNGQYVNAFVDDDFIELKKAVQAALDVLPKLRDAVEGTEDAPIWFDVQAFPEYLETLAESRGVAGFVDSLTMRIRGLLADSRKRQVLLPDDEVTLLGWLEDYAGKPGASNGAVCVVDLSLVPQDVMHMVVAVFARLIFESTQRYRRTYRHTYPTVLVLEEAHSFIQGSRRMSEPDDGVPRADQMCRHVFERIAREGRKFGLGLVLSSQRPSELSPTVLSQCNTFILHRIVNDQDQDLVARLVPDNVGGLLRELPSLPSRQAILLGWAAPVPVLVEINELAKEHQPQSTDPDFWKVWIGDLDRDGDWSKVIVDWIPQSVAGTTKTAVEIEGDTVQEAGDNSGSSESFG